MHGYESRLAVLKALAGYVTCIYYCSKIEAKAQMSDPKPEPRDRLPLFCWQVPAHPRPQLHAQNCPSRVCIKLAPLFLFLHTKVVGSFADAAICSLGDETRGDDLCAP